MNDFFKQDNIYLIVGASNNNEKYGAKVFLDLKNAGYTVVPINPHDPVVQGERAYKTITAFVTENKNIKKESVVLVLIIPPNAAFDVVKEAAKLKLTKVWFQPGAESNDAINFCAQHKIQCVHHACIMLQKP